MPGIQHRVFLFNLLKCHLEHSDTGTVRQCGEDLLTTMRDSSVAEPAPSHRHEAVSLRESDILFALFHR